MLTKQRQELLLKLLEEKGSITVAEGSALLATSESTVRRDITALDREGKLTKVFGGAVASRRFWMDTVSIIPVWKMYQHGLNGLACWSRQTNSRIQKPV